MGGGATIVIPCIETEARVSFSIESIQMDPEQGPRGGVVYDGTAQELPWEHSGLRARPPLVSHEPRAPTSKRVHATGVNLLCPHEGQVRALLGHRHAQEIPEWHTDGHTR